MTQHGEPRFDIVGNARRKQGELAGEPRVDGVRAVVVEQADVIDHLGGAGDVVAQPVDVADLGVAEPVTRSVRGQQHDESVVNLVNEMV